MSSPRLFTFALFSSVGIGLFYSTTAGVNAAEKITTPKAMEADPQNTTSKVANPLNLSETLGDYLGYGIGIHASDIDFPKAFDELKPRFIRMEFGPQWDLLEEKIPSGKSVDDYVSYLKRNYDADFPQRLDGARYSNQFFRDRNIQTIKVHFKLPAHWCSADESNQFQSEHIEDLARFHTAHLKFLAQNEVQIDYMELCNEPDGSWNGHVLPKDYARLLKRCDILFEENGFGKVKILGPGLTYLNLYDSQEPYFDALKRVAPEHLYGWSTHIWDEVEATHSRPEYTYEIWKPFLARIREIDAEKKKPIFVTEYSSDVVKYGNREWVSPRDQKTDTVLDQWPHAVRVIANSITNFNRGANGLVVYRLSDTRWHETGWGIITPKTVPDFQPKPVYHALVEILAPLPLDSKILAPSWYVHDDPITLSILHQSDENRPPSHCGKLNRDNPNKNNPTHTRNSSIIPR